MEVLSDILKSLRARGSVYFCDQMEPPWTLEFDGAGQASFHLVRRGECWLELADQRVCLSPGDLLFVAPDIRHTLTAEPPSEGPGAPTLLLCGYCQFDGETAHPVFGALPAYTVVRENELLKHPWLKSTLDHLSAEYLAQDPGSELVVNKLTEVLLVELVRINFGRTDSMGFARALSDKHIGRALSLMHDHPESHWTLDSLAERIGLSRAAFAKRFKDQVGETMFDYLTGVRMQRARDLLRDTAIPVYEVASRVGYQSDLSFTKTFKKLAGATPTAYRKRGHKS